MCSPFNATTSILTTNSKTFLRRAIVEAMRNRSHITAVLKTELLRNHLREVFNLINL